MNITNRMLLCELSKHLEPIVPRDNILTSDDLTRAFLPSMLKPLLVAGRALHDAE